MANREKDKPVPDVEPKPITCEDYFSLTPEKLELVDGFLIEPPYRHRARLNLLRLLLTNVGLARALQLAPPDRWQEAFRRVYGGKEERSLPPKEKLTYEEFLEWCDEDTWAEWDDGEVIFLTPTSVRHQQLTGFLYQVLDIFVKSHGLGEVLAAPFQMKLPKVSKGREPDILFVSRERLHLLKETHLEDAADLVVEVISPEGRLRDRGEKFAEYELSGVREYWLIDYEEKRADFYLLDPDGRYNRCSIDPEGIYRSTVIPGLWLRVDWLWQEPLPPTMDVLRQLGVI